LAVEVPILPAHAATKAWAKAHATGQVSLRPGYARPAANLTGHLLLSRTGHLRCRATVRLRAAR